MTIKKKPVPKPKKEDPKALKIMQHPTETPAKETYIKGAASHRRTESDYMSVLLDIVTLDDWRDVISNALQAAKDGDTGARAWLAQYLVGKPDGKAPTPLTVVVQQWSGGDPVADKLAKPFIDRVQYPALHQDDDIEESVRSIIAAELEKKISLLNQQQPTDSKNDFYDSTEK